MRRLPLRAPLVTAAVAAVLAAALVPAPGASASSAAAPTTPARAAGAATPAALQGARAPGQATYTNPVSAGVVDSFPDPAIIRAKNGVWYAYGTTNPILVSAGDSTPERILPVLSSPDLVTWTYVGDVFTFAGRPPAGGRTAGPAVGPRHPLRRRLVPHVLRGDRDDDHRRARRQRGRHGHGTHAGGPLDGQWVARGRPATWRPGRRRQLSLDLRPHSRDRHRRQPVALLRLLLRGPVHDQAQRRRHQGGRRPGPGRHRQQVRGLLRRPPRRLLVPLRVHGQLLCRPHDRVQRAGRAFAQPAGPLRRPAGRAADRRRAPVAHRC